MIYLIAILLCVMPINVFAMSSMPKAEQEAKGKVAPEFTLPMTTGKSMSLTQARNGKKAVLFFWATWCPHCHEELEKLRQQLQTNKLEGIQILLVDSGETKQDTLRYLKQQDIPLDSFIDENNDAAILYQVQGIPTMFFIDEKGLIRGIDHELPFNYENIFK